MHICSLLQKYFHIGTPYYMHLYMYVYVLVFSGITPIQLTTTVYVIVYVELHFHIDEQLCIKILFLCTFVVYWKIIFL